MTGENNEGHAVGEGVLHGGDNVGCTRTRSDEDDARLARDAGVALCHVSCALLMPREDEVELGGVVNRIENGENCSPRVPENMLDAVADHHLVEDLSARHADEGMVEGALRMRGKRRWGVRNVVSCGQLLVARSGRWPSVQVR